ncbi:MAG: nucleoside deaminase [bacterium]|nr:nucleoside deaminase [bacterium]
MDIKFMKSAYNEATKAFLKDEIPVGCVIVKDGKIIARAHNLRESTQLVTHHAEILAITKANKKLNSWRLDDCDIYVTLEPCPMCFSAIIQARFKNLYFGAYDKKAGACGSIINLSDYKFNHSVNVVGGIMEDDCSKLISEFFKTLRS